MRKTDIAADHEVDKLYARLRGRFGACNPRANGYVYEGYFRREQRILLSLMNTEAKIVVDVACGSGLMLQPLLDPQRQVIGVDFNDAACRAARDNGLIVLRGDAFALPLAASVVDEIVTCQFFNQQRPEAVQRFIAEGARVLRPGGRLIMVWRNGTAWIHRVALAVFGLLDRLRGRPLFPYEDHTLDAIADYAARNGMTVVSRAVSFPPLGWRSTATGSWLARLIGASNICVLERPA